MVRLSLNLVSLNLSLLILNCCRAGGPWLVADMQRRASLFELQPSLRCDVDQGIDRDGCSLSGVSARCHWEERRVTSTVGAPGTSSGWRNPKLDDDDDEDQVNSFSKLYFYRSDTVLFAQ